MLNNANGFKKIYIATGYTDLRKRTDRIKGLLWEGDGFLLLYKRLYSGAFQWPRSADEAKEISPDQYQMLMQGLEIIAKRPIEQIENPPCAM